MRRVVVRLLGPLLVGAMLAALPAGAAAKGWVCEASALRASVLDQAPVEPAPATPIQTVVVKRRVTCRDWKVVKRFKPRSDGSFRVRLRAPKDGEAAVYRMNTRVKLYDWLARTYPTFTLPRYVDLG